jgi:hypothetical protein
MLELEFAGQVFGQSEVVTAFIAFVQNVKVAPRESDAAKAVGTIAERNRADQIRAGRAILGVDAMLTVV